MTNSNPANPQGPAPLRLFNDEGGPRVFATAPGAPFAQAVAAGLAARAGAASDDPLALSDVVLIASTRRAIRSLRSAFARTSQAMRLKEILGGAACTPRMTSLADLDAELLLDPLSETGAEAIPPAIDPLRRQLLLGGLVRQLLLRDASLGAPCVAPQLAKDLAALLDDCHAAGVPLERLTEAAPDRHAAHWGLSQKFLEIIVAHWPHVLADEAGAPIDPADRRARQVAALTARWAEAPLTRPVIVAGSPTDAAAAALIAAVARLPQGAVVLPGYDRWLDPSAATALLDGRAPEHPQAALAQLVAQLGLSVAEAPGAVSVAAWESDPGAEQRSGRRDGAARQRLLAQAMRPAPATDHWRAAAQTLAAEAPAATERATLLEAASPREEAAAIALSMREALETPGRSVALITPDRTLSRRVAAELARWKIAPDDSSGRPLALTPPGVFLHSVLEAALSDCGPAALLALLKHPLCGAGHARGPHLRLTRRLEREALRGAPPLLGAAGVAARLREAALAEAADEALIDLDPSEDGALAEGSPAAPRTTASEPIDDLLDWAARGPDAAETPTPDAHGLGPGEAADAPDILAWFDGVAALLEPLTTALRRDEIDLIELVDAHRTAALALSEQLEAEGPRAQLFDKIAGQTLDRFLTRLGEEADAFGAITPGDYPALLGHLMGQEAVREPFGRHPRALILGALEARMQSADLVILAGLNEGVWPKAPEPDPWLSRDMRREVGLPPLEANIGLSAHDFFLAASAPDIILSRTRKADGAPTTPSRWLLRLTNLLGGVAEGALADMRARGAALLAKLALLEAGPADGKAALLAPLTPAPRPRPTPPLAARPRRLSVTDVETLIRDPYAIYAKKTLRLRAMEPLEATPDQRDRGQLLHHVVERFVEESQGPMEPEAAAALFERISKEALAPYEPWPVLRAFWGARLSQIQEWFLEQEAARREAGAPAALETVGALRFETALGECWLTAKADRIDRAAAGGYAIYDYKAGKPPSPDQRKIFAKQLPLEAAILASAGFSGAPPGPVDKLAYLTLTGGPLGGFETAIAQAADEVSEQAEEAMSGLARLLGGYANPRQGYAARSRPQHIAFDGDYDHLSRLGEWRPERGGAQEANQGADPNGADRSRDEAPRSGGWPRWRRRAKTGAA
ncbi:MAG: double-strand break repair protein AddB [Pseudomonadota bacterium]